MDSACIQITMEQFRFVRYSGEAIQAIIPDLGKLRIAVFYEFPYLYEGSMEYEEEYLKIYTRSADSFVFGIYHNETLIGATTCIPLSDEAPEIQKPFVDAEMNLQEIMYFGESILLPEYRGKGFGHRFFDEREAFTRSKNRYGITAFCAVDRPEDHPLCPADYRPNDVFWTKRGYQRIPELTCHLLWLDRGENEETAKPLTFWTYSWK